jgi:hypothetical protein
LFRGKGHFRGLLGVTDSWFFWSWFFWGICNNFFGFTVSGFFFLLSAFFGCFIIS